MATSIQSCEVNVDGVWNALGLKEAQLLHRNAIKRCPICHGRISLLGSYGLERHLSLSPRRAHPGCPLNPKHFSGVSTRHLGAVE
ncbi:hypothetical protein [Methylobacterium sp. P5_C11]